MFLFICICFCVFVCLCVCAWEWERKKKEKKKSSVVFNFLKPLKTSNMKTICDKERVCCKCTVWQAKIVALCLGQNITGVINLGYSITTQGKSCLYVIRSILSLCQTSSSWLSIIQLIVTQPQGSVKTKITMHAYKTKIRQYKKTLGNSVLCC